MVDDFMTKADELGSEEMWTHISNLRQYAAEYHNLSLKAARREERGIDLTEIQENFVETKAAIEAIISENS